MSILNFTPRHHAAQPPSLRTRRTRCCAQSPARLELRVLVSHDGRLICPDLPAGRYTVASWRAGLASRGSEQAVASAANCTLSNGRDCGLFCTLNEEGDLVRPFTRWG
jgi:hypothetical protein